MVSVISRSSPNFDARNPRVPLRFIVLHYTGMKSAEEALARLCDPAAKVSAHYLIDEEGQAFHLVDEQHRAWHAGESCWQGITDINSASIGVELSNPGHEFGYQAFPSAQINALKELMHDIIRRHNLSPAATLAHSDVAPERKQDPGELFPWRELAAEGLGLWPVPQEADYASASEGDTRALLKAIGYECLPGGEKPALLAFQRHYYPENLTGEADPETVARLRALAAKAHSGSL
jgi:N-acetylmuramoyl-L-alanine amidase